jgi:hypothetical protein
MNRNVENSQIISLLLTFAPLHAVPDLPTTTLELVGRIASSEK